MSTRTWAVCIFIFRLRENCEVLLFTYSEDYGRKAEELLWRKIFYDLIQKLKYFRKVKSCFLAH